LRDAVTIGLRDTVTIGLRDTVTIGLRDTVTIGLRDTVTTSRSCSPVRNTSLKVCRSIGQSRGQSRLASPNRHIRRDSGRQDKPRQDNAR
jgi:hypothetical protein